MTSMIKARVFKTTLMKGFDGKRPFGNSDWQFDIYHALVQAGCVDGTIDEDGYLETFDIENVARADHLIAAAIRHLGDPDA